LAVKSEKLFLLDLVGPGHSGRSQKISGATPNQPGMRHQGCRRAVLRLSPRSLSARHLRDSFFILATGSFYLIGMKAAMPTHGVNIARWQMTNQQISCYERRKRKMRCGHW